MKISISRSLIKPGQYGQGSLFIRLRYWAIKKLAGNSHVMLNIDHGDGRIYVFVTEDCLLDNVKNVSIVAASDRAEQTFKEFRDK